LPTYNTRNGKYIFSNIQQQYTALKIHTKPNKRFSSIMQRPKFIYLAITHPLVGFSFTTAWVVASRGAAEEGEGGDAVTGCTCLEEALEERGRLVSSRSRSSLSGLSELLVASVEAAVLDSFADTMA
jgi:hypothetical protein